MKLLLHWLLWDLRRFRWPLLAWTAFVIGFVCYIGWLHANLLTIEPRLLSYNEGIAAVLGIVEFFLLLHILTTDPAAGTRPFWKTRPPSGFALAGAKAALVLLFFLVLPLLAHWIMRRACGLHDGGPGWSGRSWAWFLCWTEGFVLSVLVLAASGARNAGYALGRMAAGAGLLFLPVFIASLLGWGSHSALVRWVRSAFGHIDSAVYSLVTVTVWLLAGLAVFVFIRRTRTPSRLMNAAPLLLPAIALAAGVWLAEKIPPGQRMATMPALPPLPAETVSALKIGEPLLRGGISEFTQETSPPGFFCFYLYLHLAGLPPDCVAVARWQGLNLIHPDGRMVRGEEAMWGLTSLPKIHLGTDILHVGGARFPREKLAPFSRTVCRAEGVLQVTVLRRLSAAIPVEAGQRIEQTNETILLRDVSGLLRLPGRDILDLEVESRVPYSTTEFRLQHHADPQKRLPLIGSGWNAQSGYFMHYSRNDQMLSPAPQVSPLVQAIIKRDAEQNRLNDWRLHVGWLNPEGSADVPVVLENLFIPRQEGDHRTTEEILAALKVTPEMPAAEVEQTVKLALSLSALGRESIGVSDSDPRVAALRKFITAVPRKHLPVLLDIAEADLPPGNMKVQTYFDWPFRKGIAALMDTSDVTALREKRPRVFRYLRHDLTERKLITPNEARDPDADFLFEPELKELSSERLLAMWQQCKFFPNNWLDLTPLKYALHRGLPWAAAELAELVDLVPGNLGDPEFLKAFSKISDCPADHKAAIPWLQQNAARLTWDAAAKRWMLPKP